MRKPLVKYIHLFVAYIQYQSSTLPPLPPHKNLSKTYLISRGESEAHAHIQDCVSKPPNGSTDNIQFPGDMCPSETDKNMVKIEQGWGVS